MEVGSSCFYFENLQLLALMNLLFLIRTIITFTYFVVVKNHPLKPEIPVEEPPLPPTILPTNPVPISYPQIINLITAIFFPQNCAEQKF